MGKCKSLKKGRVMWGSCHKSVEGRKGRKRGRGKVKRYKWYGGRQNTKKGGRVE